MQKSIKNMQITQIWAEWGKSNIDKDYCMNYHRFQRKQMNIRHIEQLMHIGLYGS